MGASASILPETVKFPQNDSTVTNPPRPTSIPTTTSSNASISHYGIRLSNINEFYETCCHGKQNLLDKTIYEVDEEFIQPFIKRYQLSFCEILYYHYQHIAIAPANVYITYSHEYLFLPFIKQLEEYYSDKNPNIVIWLDIFSYNPWIDHPEESHWSVMSKSLIDEIGKCMMVLIPWDNLEVWNRTWILYELYCTFITGNHFEISLNSVDRQGMIDDIANDCAFMNTVLETISIEDSETKILSEKENILKVLRYVEEDLETINSIICQKMRDWLIQLAEEEITKLTNQGKKDMKDERKLYQIMYGLGNIYAAQAELDRAESIQADCLTKRKELFGEKDPDTLESMMNLGSILQTQEKTELAEELLVTVLATTRELFGNQHVKTLSALHALGLLYQQWKKYEFAEPLYQEVYTLNHQIHSDQHPATLKALNNLAILFDEQGKHDQAIPLYLQCIKISRALNGDNHLLTVLLLSNVASLYFTQEKYDLAIPLYEECIDRNQILHGKTHPDTFQSMNNLAMVYETVERYEDALAVYKECINFARQELGENDPLTLKSLNNLASFYFNQAEYDLAESYYLLCLEKSELIYGSDHAFTIILKENIALLEKSSSKNNGNGDGGNGSNRRLLSGRDLITADMSDNGNEEKMTDIL